MKVRNIDTIVALKSIFKLDFKYHFKLPCCNNCSHPYLYRPTYQSQPHKISKEMEEVWHTCISDMCTRIQAVFRYITLFITLQPGNISQFHWTQPCMPAIRIQSLPILVKIQYFHLYKARQCLELHFRPPGAPLVYMLAMILNIFLEQEKLE